jgi:hypothetical protein
MIQLIKNCETYDAFIELVDLGTIKTQIVSGWNYDIYITVELIIGFQDIGWATPGPLPQRSFSWSTLYNISGDGPFKGESILQSIDTMIIDDTDVLEKISVLSNRGYVV